jgi:acetyl esterase/lipase
MVTRTEIRLEPLGRVRCALLLFGVAIGLVPVSGVAESVQKQPALQSERSEFRRLLPLTSFYSTPNPLPAGQPGELIRSEEFDAYQLPEGVSAVRILYHSRSANGADVAASGVVLTPDEPPPGGGWPIIAWAHGFTGTARRCAPSLMRNLNEGPFLSMYVKLGYALVATDYTGLGTNFRNASVDKQSNAADVIYSVAASRAAVPHLGRGWVVMGESEGGLAALGVAELERDIRDPYYLGSIAVSGVADAKDLYKQIANGNSPGQFVFLVYGIQTLYPRFQLNKVLTEKALALYHQIENACTVTSDSEVPANQTLKPGWEDNCFVQQFFAGNTIGQKPTYGPLLIISSDADPVVRTGMTAQTVARMCKQRDTVQFHKYQSAEFGRVLGDSIRNQLTWIEARFAGRPASSNCH